jgi:hypothetical protein
VSFEFPDVEALLLGWLETVVAADRVNTESPDDFAGLLPFVRAYRFGGSTSTFSDFSSVQIDVFSMLRSEGLPLARSIRDSLIGPPPPVAGFDRVECNGSPVELPWADDKQVRRWGASYRIVCRRRPTNL